MLFATTIGQKLFTVCDVCSCMCVRAIGSSSCHAVLPHGLGSRLRRDCRPKSNLRVTTPDSRSHLLDEIESLLSLSLCVCVLTHSVLCVLWLMSVSSVSLWYCDCIAAFTLHLLQVHQ